MLRDLRSVLGWPCLAQVLSISLITLREWFETGKRPSAAGIRLVWLLWADICRPGTIKTIFDVSTWGRFTELGGPEHAGKRPLRATKRRIGN